MEAITSVTPEKYPDTNTRKGISIFALHADMLDEVCVFLPKLLGPVSLFVLLIAFANLRNRLPAKSTRRIPEWLIRIVFD